MAFLSFLFVVYEMTTLFSGRTEENHQKHQSGYPVSGPRFEPGTSRY
jgi:hypothetical protein